MTEVWLPVAEYEGRYQVSNLGRVKSVRREHTIFGRFMRQLDDRIMALYSHHNGYKVVFLRKPGTHVKFFVHQLVARAFIPNPEGKPVVNHKDCNKANNHLSNLEWMSFSENTQYYYAMRQKLALDVPF